MTDCELTLHYLKQAGNKGIHSFHLNHLVGTSRIAARINDLKNQGHQIASKPERMGRSVGVRYFLASQPIVVPQKIVWEFDNNTGIARRVVEPIQQQLAL